jgi:predicted nucleotidyltransferase
MKREQVINLIRQKQTELSLRYHVESITLFGSVARDEACMDSDVDILVEFSQPVGLFHFIDLKQYLEEILRCKVDLGTPRSLKPYILDEEILWKAIQEDIPHWYQH